MRAPFDALCSQQANSCCSRNAMSCKFGPIFAILTGMLNCLQSCWCCYVQSIADLYISLPFVNANMLLARHTTVI